MQCSKVFFPLIKKEMFAEAKMALRIKSIYEREL